MTSTALKKFLVFYLIPQQTMAEWKNIDSKHREASEKKMMDDWAKWCADRSEMILSTEVGGQTKRVTADAVTEMKNDIVVFSFVQGESHDAVMKEFMTHPHLQIPNASIEVMEVKPM
mgnify:CR=1 FL=1